MPVTSMEKLRELQKTNALPTKELSNIRLLKITIINLYIKVGDSKQTMTKCVTQNIHIVYRMCNCFFRYFNTIHVLDVILSTIHGRCRMRYRNSVSVHQYSHKTSQGPTNVHGSQSINYIITKFIKKMFRIRPGQTLRQNLLRKKKHYVRMPNVSGECRQNDSYVNNIFSVG